MDSFKTRGTLKIEGRSYEIFRLVAAASASRLAKLPYCLRVLLENLLRNEDGKTVKKSDIEAVLCWDPRVKPDKEIAFRPARVLLQDFTGVPAVVDLAAMREAIKKMGGDPKRINPLNPVDLVIDHSVQVDAFGSKLAFKENAELEFHRNKERYVFLKWGQKAFDDFRVVPPDTGIVHQVNLEYLAHVVFTGKANGVTQAYPDTLVGTDSHTTMINGLGVLGWGVGGIEAEAAMLGQPISMLLPQVVGFKLHGKLPEGATATDVGLTVTQMLRSKGVVDKFVEFFGPGLSGLTLADRATIANMAPEYGATMGFFPVDKETLDYLRLTGRDESQVKLVEAYTKEQGLFRADSDAEPVFSDMLELDLGSVEPSLAGPKRPQDRVALKNAKAEFRKALVAMLEAKANGADKQELQDWIAEGGSGKRMDPAMTKPHKSLGFLSQTAVVEEGQKHFEIGHGSVVIAAITSCTNTSNPAVMIGAGLLAKKAVERGLETRPWVKTSLAPGSKVVVDYLTKTRLLEYLEKLNFHLVGFGCTTCIGNSGPLPEKIGQAVKKNEFIAAAVLSGNRNFEGRINPLVRANYLASPPLVVAYALAGHMDIDFTHEPLGKDRNGKEVFLKDVWPSGKEVSDAMRDVQASMFTRQYASVFEGDALWRSLEIPGGDTFAWDPKSTYVKHPPYFEHMPRDPEPLTDIKDARVLALLGDSVTTDHISPAGSIAQDSPAGQYLIGLGVKPRDFNSYGARRGNHEVMLRGTFANIRLKNLLAPGTEGCWTKHFPDGQKTSIYDAAMKYQSENIPLIVLAGKEYGTGSSRDWAAKGTHLLGVRAVIAESFERIHRSNLIGMGVLPLEFENPQSHKSLGLSGQEVYTIEGVAKDLRPGKKLCVVAKDKAQTKTFAVRTRIDTPQELVYYQHGGILQYVLRQLLSLRK